MRDERCVRVWGLGSSFKEPLPLVANSEHQQRENRYRLVSDSHERLVLDRALKDEAWQPQYRFAQQPYQYSDYAEMCSYHQTSPESHFTRQRICSRLTPRGRISLSDMRLIITEDGARSERLLKNEAEYAEVLRQRFGIVM